MTYCAADGRTVREMLHRANQSLAAALSSVDRDAEAAVDDMVAARLLIATALLLVSQGTAFVG